MPVDPKRCDLAQSRPSLLSSSKLLHLKSQRPERRCGEIELKSVGGYRKLSSVCLVHYHHFP
eukprot:2046829-Rhodomonas_salina.1